MSSDQSKDKKDSSPTEIEEASLVVPLNQEMSLENIDEFLEQEDPDFAKQLTEIAKDKSLKAIDIVYTQKDLERSAEKDWWSNQKGPLRFLFKVFPQIYLITLSIKKLFRFIKDRLIGLSIRFKNFTYFLATDGRRNAQKYSLKVIHSITALFAAYAKFFKKLSLKLKLAFVGLILSFAAALFLVYLFSTKDLIHSHDDLFILRFSQVADSVINYEDESLEAFYDNLRASQNLFLIPKIMVNLRRVPGGSANPMAAFEFIFETDSPEVVIELKDREYEIREQIFRTIEKFSYHDIEDVPGKRMMCDTILREVDKILISGKLKKVNLKTFVLKPE